MTATLCTPTKIPPMTSPRALIIRTAGTNCDAEMVRAFAMAGAEPELVHLDRLIDEPGALDRFDLIGLPGGFSYGDDIASGRVFAMRCRLKLLPALRGAVARGVPIIGVCNGFQVLAQLRLFFDPSEDGQAPVADVALADNQGARFIDDWVRIEVNAESPCVWTSSLSDANLTAAEQDAVMRLPLASGEGRFTPASDAALDLLEKRGQIAMRYIDNPNGSIGRVAGVCDPTGLVLGLMPHPDRYLDWTLHPFWTRLDASTRRGMTPGLRLFASAVEHVRRQLPSTRFGAQDAAWNIK